MADLAICNEALAEVPQDPIASIDDLSTAARECKRQYSSVLHELLAITDWEPSRKRATLAEVTNDRSDWWPHAYALPSDLINPTKVIPSLSAYDGLWADQYLLEGQTIAYPNWPVLLANNYEIAGGVLYTFESIAVLEYVSTDPGTFSPLFRRAFVLELAARIVLPITKSVQRQQALMAMAENAKQRAAADNENRQPRNYDRKTISTSQMAREGWWS